MVLLPNYPYASSIFFSTATTATDFYCWCYKMLLFYYVIEKEERMPTSTWMSRRMTPNISRIQGS